MSRGIGKSAAIALIASFLAGCTTQVAPVDLAAPGEIVPRAEGSVLIDGRIAPNEWTGAWTREEAFTMEAGSRYDGVYPLRLQLAHNQTHLLVGVVLNISPNLDGSDVVGDHLTVLLAADHDELAPPEDAIRAVSGWHHGSSWYDEHWDGRRWTPEEGHLPNHSGHWAAVEPVDDATLAYELAFSRAEPDTPIGGNFRLALRLGRSEIAGYETIHQAMWPPGADETSARSWLRLRFTE